MRRPPAIPPAAVLRAPFGSSALSLHGRQIKARSTTASRMFSTAAAPDAARKFHTGRLSAVQK